VSRLFLPCFGLSRVLACRGRSYLSICSPWLPLAGSHPVADIARVFLAVAVSLPFRVSVLSVLSVCLCVCDCVAVWLSKRGRLSPCCGVCASSCRGLPVFLSGCQAFEQVFRTRFLMPFSECQNVSNRTEPNFEPNPKTFQPNRTESLLVFYP
jgi:hypothetical protein